MSENYKNIQAENYSLRQYIIHLQGRLLDGQHEIPPAPANISLSPPSPVHTHAVQPLSPHVPQRQDRSLGTLTSLTADDRSGSMTDDMNAAQVVAARRLAAAAQNLKHARDAKSDFGEPNKRLKADATPDEDIIRSQLQNMGGADEHIHEGTL